MSDATLRNLAIVLFALVIILVGLELSDEDGAASTGTLLFPGLKAGINDVDALLIETPDQEPIQISARSGAWVVASKADYPASVAKIREVLLALADAEILEQKTANPERYSALGVQDPESADSNGVRLTVTGGDANYAVIVGSVNQGSNRYARVAGEAQSVLIDKNPDLPAEAAGWLREDLIDIDGADVRSVEIRHADGESIRIAKTSSEETDFTVEAIPQGRELSYTTVANGIGSALSDLRLDDVRAVVASEASVVTTYELFDGRRIEVSGTGADEDAWVRFSGAFEAPAVVEVLTEEVAEDEGDDASEPEDAAQPDSDPSAEIAELNARLGGWQFKIPDYKRNQLTRRWEDILKSEDEEE